MSEYLIVLDYSVSPVDIHVFKIHGKYIDIVVFLKNNKLNINNCEWWFTNDVPNIINHD